MWEGFVDTPDAFKCPAGTRAELEGCQSILCKWVKCVPVKKLGSNQQINTIGEKSNSSKTNVGINSNSRTCSDEVAPVFSIQEGVINCDESNTAAFGNCVASGFRSLEIEGVPSTAAPAWAGLSFSMRAVKKDAYGQTMASDSSTVLQVTSWTNKSGDQKASIEIGGNWLARLDRGVATFSVTITPVFEEVNFSTARAVLSSVLALLVQDTEVNTGVQLQSVVALLSLWDGAAVCPQGYILALDSPPSTGRLSGAGTCQRCQGGTYSVHPLAPNPDLASSAPSCLTCPAGADCSRGGNETNFRAGKWVVRDGMLVLEGCPPGHELVNSTAGTSSGTFWHNGQQCRPCLPGQYIVNPNRDLCQDCPPGANCSGAIAPKVAGSAWTVAAGVWALVGCPAGYYLGESQCLPCPAGSYCTEGSAGPTPCGIDRFARPAANASAACAAVAFVFVSVRLPLGREALTSARQAALAKALAHAAGELDPQDLVVSGIVQADLSMEVTVKIARPDPATASAAAESVGQQAPREMVRAGFGGAVLVGVEETACVAGWYLGAAKRCSMCPARFYCSGGATGMQACGSGSFSAPGANASAACLPSLFVSLRLTIPIDPRLFNISAIARLLQAVAEVAGVSVERVVLDDATLELGRRSARLLATYSEGVRGPSFRSKPGHALNKSTLPTSCLSMCPNQDKSCLSVCRDFLLLQQRHSHQIAIFRRLLDSAFQQLEASHQQVDIFQEQLELCRVSQQPRPTSLLDSSMSQSTKDEVSAFAKGFEGPGYSGGGRRDDASTTSLTAQIAVPTAAQARVVSSRLTPNALSTRLAAQGMPPASILSVTVSGDSVTNGGESISVALVAGVAVGGLVVVALGLAGLGYGLLVLWRHRWHQSFVRALASCRAGDSASAQHLPLDLARYYAPEAILGKGAFGCVVLARLKKTELKVAIKLVLPGQQTFKDYELRQLRREKKMLEMLTLRHEAHAVGLVNSVRLPAGVEAALVTQWVCWFIMEQLVGETLGHVLEREALDEKECIRVARDVLAGLKALHAEGVIHRDVKPDNIMRCYAPKMDHKGGDAGKHVYKLIDFGTVVGVDAEVARKEMLTLTGQRNMGQGTLPYMSPEMFTQPDQASYPTDLWSLGVSLFQLATRQLPFDAESELLFGLVVAGNLEVKAPSVLDHLDNEHRARFDRQLALVAAKALEKRVADRYCSGDEMHEAVYNCLILRGEAFYSAFISYRVASEAPLAHILFDELNHSVTPAGHRVTVYWDAFRLVKGEDWEEGFAMGLLCSLVFLPLLSYGATAPLAALPEEHHATLVAEGWVERPIGRGRLVGRESDAEDNVLKELLVASSLLALPPQAQERSLLRAAYPLLVGRQEPEGHPNYPRMGNYFSVQGGGGVFPKLSSPPTSRAVAAFLRDKAGLSEATVAGVLDKSVAWVVESFTRLQGCQLWSHAADLGEAELTKQQKEMVGKGFTGPAVNLDGVTLTAEQRGLCQKGFDQRQLQMLKAQVRAKVGDIHDVIDRAVARMAEGGAESGRTESGAGLETVVEVSAAVLEAGVAGDAAVRADLVVVTA